MKVNQMTDTTRENLAMKIMLLKLEQLEAKEEFPETLKKAVDLIKEFEERKEEYNS